MISAISGAIPHMGPSPGNVEPRQQPPGSCRDLPELVFGMKSAIRARSA